MLSSFLRELYFDTALDLVSSQVKKTTIHLPARHLGAISNVTGPGCQ